MRRLVQITLTLAVVAALAACGDAPAPVTAPDPTADPASETVALVAVDGADTRESVERRSGGTVVVWRPEAGFAVVEGGAAPSGELGPQGGGREANRGNLGAPGYLAGGEATGQGWTIWSGGWTIWSGGWTIWSGGWTIWSGGEGDSLTPTENHPEWHQIGLFDAHVLAPALGAGVEVAVIDSGIDLAHPAFAGALAPAGEWFDFVDGDAIPQEVMGAEDGPNVYGHGTGVAGVVRQVAPGATILPLRALRPDGSGEVADVAAAIDHALRHGSDVINLSLGTRTHSPVLTRMVELAAEQGVYVVSAAGNTGDRKVVYPAARSRHHGAGGDMSIGVGSVDSDDIKSEHSTYGNKLELLAPGVTLATAAPDERLATWSGTSVATAVVTGALALGAGEHPQAPLAEVLTGTAVDIDALNPRYAGKLGEGRLDVAAFLEALGD